MISRFRLSMYEHMHNIYVYLYAYACMCYIYIWICKSSACPLSHLDEMIFILLLGFSSLEMCVCVHCLIFVLLFDGFHYNTNQSLNNATDKPWKTTITKTPAPPPPSMLALPQISHIYAIIQYTRSKIFVAEHMIVSRHQPRCQDIMANLLGVCRGSEGRGKAFV